MKQRYQVIGSTKTNPWYVLDWVFAEDEDEANRMAILRFGMQGFRTVQLASVFHTNRR